MTSLKILTGVREMAGLRYHQERSTGQPIHAALKIIECLENFIENSIFILKNLKISADILICPAIQALVIFPTCLCFLCYIKGLLNFSSCYIKNSKFQVHNWASIEAQVMDSISLLL